jgi:hypothetical protein
MIKTAKKIFVCAVIVLSASSLCAAEEYKTATGLQEETDLGIRPEEDLTGTGADKRYVRQMRDLDDDYRSGGLTRTEYIQRKREIDSLDR